MSLNGGRGARESELDDQYTAFLRTGLRWLLSMLKASMPELETISANTKITRRSTVCALRTFRCTPFADSKSEANNSMLGYGHFVTTTTLERHAQDTAY